MGMYFMTNYSLVISSSIPTFKFQFQKFFTLRHKSIMSVHNTEGTNLGIPGRHLQAVGTALGLKLTSKLNLIIPKINKNKTLNLYSTKLNQSKKQSNM